MSEYWKSTPKYWCKHCSAFVKDTKFERQQHEATGKHQGALKRFLRGIQNDAERGEREKDRARAEVDRLNKAVGSSSSPAAHQYVSPTRKPTSSSSTSQPSATDRKKQLATLAEMGLAIPDEFRGDMALAGDWQVVSQRKIEETQPDDSLNIGVRKRKYEGQEEEEEAGETVAKRGWGSTVKSYPGHTAEDPDLDALLLGVKPVKRAESTPVLEHGQVDGVAKQESFPTAAKDVPDSESTAAVVSIKKEEPQGDADLTRPPKVEDTASADATTVVFKKRKHKTLRPG